MTNAAANGAQTMNLTKDAARKLEGPRLDSFVDGMAGKRLDYATLIAKAEAN